MQLAKIFSALISRCFISCVPQSEIGFSLSLFSTDLRIEIRMYAVHNMNTEKNHICGLSYMWSLELTILIKCELQFELTNSRILILFVR